MAKKDSRQVQGQTPAFGMLSLPRVQKAVLRNFTLFTLKREVEVDVSDGVFCLAGANGLGKSTFLLAINFGITGIVPDRAFNSVDDYYSDSKQFSASFFSGRIDDNDRSSAEISLVVKVAADTLCLTRGMFEPDQLRAFEVIDANGNVLVDTEDKSPADRQRVYEQEITRRVNLSSFQQLVFLQHFVLTFDERRHLLFWDERALEQTLYIAFGIDPKEAYQADALRQKMQKAESYARNANWQASEFLKKIRSLQDTSVKLGKRVEKVSEKYTTLEKARDAAQQSVDRIRAGLDDAQVTLADLSAKQATRQNEYARAFANRVARTATVAMHPIVVASRRECSCSLCGSSIAGVVSEIESRVAGTSCPLCGSTLGGVGKKKDLERLKKLDAELASVSQKLSEVVARRQRLLEELDAAQHKFRKAQIDLDEYAADNAASVEQLKARSTGGVKSVIDEYTARMNYFLAEKGERYKERDEHRRKLKTLRKDLQVRYAAAEGIFLPQFTSLAGSFVGIDLDVKMAPTPSTGITLVLEMRGASRREHHQLSESQRFFIDIALRMALAQFMSAPGTPAGLYIDTPEGSLDVAYETKAGQMFSQFAHNGFGVIMTANINGSRILTAMAQECGPRRMNIQRMTAWTELSDVQTEEEALFEEVYRQIEKALAKGGRRVTS